MVFRSLKGAAPIVGALFPLITSASSGATKSTAAKAIIFIKIDIHIARK